MAVMYAVVELGDGMIGATVGWMVETPAGVESIAWQADTVTEVDAVEHPGQYHIAADLGDVDHGQFVVGVDAGAGYVEQARSWFAPPDIGAAGGLDADELRAALGLAAADLDDQLAALPTDADVNAACDTALADYDGPTKAELDAAVALLATAVGLDAAEASVLAAIGAISSITADDVLDEAVEGSLTLRQAVRVVLAFVAGKASGGGTTSIAFRDQSDTKDRIVGTVDAQGNRTAITLDVT